MTKDEAKMKTLKLVRRQKVRLIADELQVNQRAASCPIEFRVMFDFIDEAGFIWELDQVFHETLHRLEKK